MKAEYNLMRLVLSITLQKKILFLIIFLYPVLFIFQGGDLTDVGFFAMSYQNFFPNLQLGETNSISILSDFIGALWLVLFPNSGILGLKILNLLFLYSVIGIIYSLLKDLTNNRLLLLFGIFCGIVFETRYFLGFGRDTVSWFFLIFTSFFVIKGLNSNRNVFFYISGVLFVFASFSRFPNIVFLLLFPLILGYFHFYKCEAFSLRQIWLPLKQYLLFILGAFTSLAITFYVFKYFNIYDIFINNLDFIIKSADNSNASSYSFLRLLNSYFREGIIFFPHLISILSLILTTSLIYRYSKIKQTNYPLLLFITLLFCASCIVYLGFSYTSNIKYLVPAFCIYPLIMSLIKKDKFSVLVALFSVIALTQLAGTNTGLFLKLSKGFMVLIPLALLILLEKKKVVYQNIKIYTKPVLVIGTSFVLFFSLYARIGWIYHVDEGLGCRLRAIYPVEHKKMAGILSTKENAIHIKQLSNAIEKNIDGSKNLFIYGHQPLFYYLTETTPPVKKFWLTNNYVQVDELFTSIEKSIKSTGKYPMIVDTKQKIMGEKGQIRLEQFLKEYGYIRGETTENFEIWIKKSPQPLSFCRV
jgi:hypothetical protein